MLPLERKIALTFSAVVALLVALGGFLIYNAHHTADMFRKLDRANHVLHSAELVMLHFLQIQSATRGYVLTGDEAFLEPNQTGRADLPRALDALDAACALHPGHRERARQIRLRRNALSVLANEAINARRAGESDLAAIQRIIKEGKATMDEVRVLVEAIESEERELLRDLSGAAQAGAERTIYLISALGLIGLSTVVYAGVRATRDVQARTRAEQALRALNDDLERRVARRTTELAQSTKRLQRLSSRLLDIQESERRALAHELHDELGQAMTAVKLSLQALERLPAGSPDLATRLHSAIELTNRCLEQTRSLSLNLHPPMLEDLGLVASVHWLVSRYDDACGLTVTLEENLGDTRLPAAIEVACFRIVQESLTNVLRHAQARHATVTLSRQEQTLIASVRDDGRGFDAAAARERAMQQGLSLGLLGLEERAMLAGGTLSIETAPGRGTRIAAVFPLAFSP